MALTKESRDSLHDNEFAVPEKRALPIPDETHTRMAWKMVDKTKDLSPDQRDSAKKKILQRAKELGIDTTGWETETASNQNAQSIDDDGDEYPDHETGGLRGQNLNANKSNVIDFETQYKLETIYFEAMAIKLPDIKNHPNKVPFSGILTRIDQPSDEAVGGAGKRIIIPRAVAEQALPSLLAMAVDFKPSLDGHDSQNKIGLITEANIVGNAIEIKGFFYGADFPDEVKRIQSEKAKLGFSYEAQAQIRSMNDDPWVLKSCIFTGAAILYKDKAAYQSTSLAASAESPKMSDEILNLLKELKANSEKEMADMKKEIAEIKANSIKNDDDAKLKASSLMSKVKAHADKIRACSAGLSADGIGTHPSQGHAMALNKIADNLEASAASGEMPHVYQGNDFLQASKATPTVTDTKDTEIEGLKSQLKDEVASMKTALEDLKKTKFEAAAAPERKTLAIGARNVLLKAGISPKDGEKLNIDDLDMAFKKANIPTHQRMVAKTSLRESNMI